MKNKEYGTHFGSHCEDIQAPAGVQLGLQVQDGLLYKYSAVDLDHLTRGFEGSLLLGFKGGAGGRQWGTWVCLIKYFTTIRPQVFFFFFCGYVHQQVTHKRKKGRNQKSKSINLQGCATQVVFVDFE
jgi:hypothetical protein